MKYLIIVYNKFHIFLQIVLIFGLFILVIFLSLKKEFGGVVVNKRRTDLGVSGLNPGTNIIRES